MNAKKTSPDRLEYIKQYQKEHIQQHYKNALRHYYLKSMKDPDHKFHKMNTKEKLQQIVQESKTIKRGGNNKYKTDEERKAAKTKSRNEITYRYMRKKKLFNDEAKILLQIEY